MSSEHIIKRHNKNLMLYHLVCVKFRRTVFTRDIENSLKDICSEIEKQYEIHFVEIGADEDYVHFLFQSVPMMLPTRMVTLIKSITARLLFKRYPEIQKMV